ncbi:FAD/NAD(P)-binding oxidoreductase [Actinidia rufa]|uniref:FAD/NAD(P)-binding oxidoreductase n=1 Tax=Actinidia rufa TaxID=165716 RepID=A0A7J0HEE8_9ERIC|nr:FAD/NAD(P)-binding oxidoreductase [Actinidia rufa]
MNRHTTVPLPSSAAAPTTAPAHSQSPSPPSPARTLPPSARKSPPGPRPPSPKSDAPGERLCYVNVDLAKSPDLVADFVTPGQYVQIRIPPALVDPPPSPAYFYIASPVGSRREFQFLVKSVPGKTAGVLCTLKKGDVVELSEIDGNGFDIDQLSPPEDYPTVLLFTTGYGISPVRSLIETGFSAHKRSDVRLYYGAENLQRMAYQTLLLIGLVQRGHVQNVYLNDKPIANPKAAVAVLSGKSKYD